MYPTKTYKYDLETQRIVGSIDGADAYWQSIQKRLSTEKFYWNEYSKNYGMKNIQSLIGKSRGYIEAHFPIYVRDCVMNDDRTKDVTDFTYEEISPTKLLCSCIIWSVYGSQKITKEIEV